MDNSMTWWIVNKMIKRRRNCAIYMQFYWVRDCCAQGHFIMYWVLGMENKGDCHTKHHVGVHHRRIRPEYLHKPRYLAQSLKIMGPTGLQGCVEFGLSPDL
eukprot:14407617-Ditylum_brightwellii.AAC.1